MKKPNLEPDEALAYFACYCRPKFLLPLVAALSAEGLRVECPTTVYRRREPRRNRTQEMRRALIGGMFFCRVDCWPLGQRLVAGVNLGSIRRVMWMGKPAVIPDADLNALRLASLAADPLQEAIGVGSRVVVVAGAFVGAEGRVIGHSSGYLIVQLDRMLLPIKMAPFLLKLLR